MKSFLTYIFFPLTYPLSLVYRFLFFLDRSLKKQEILPDAFVISVGNLSVGGSGKTPFSVLLSRLLISKEKKVTLLSRGYKAIKSGQGAKVSPVDDPADVGDEPLLLKKKVKDAEVIIGRKRYESYLQYSDFLKEKNHTVVLDDGFQHHRLARDLDFVLVDSETGIGNGFCIPAGFLRESESALSRAHSVIFTKYEKGFTPAADELEKRWRNEYRHLSFFHLSYLPDRVLDLNWADVPESTLSGKKTVLFTGIARSESFFRTAGRIPGLSISDTVSFSDHYSFQRTDIEALERKFGKDTVFLCTEKDAVKLSFFKDGISGISVMFLSLKTEIIENREFEQFVMDRISMQVSRRTEQRSGL